MPSSTSSHQPIFPKLRRLLLTNVEVEALSADSTSELDSIVIWPTSRSVESNDFAEVTVWQAPRPTILSLSPLPSEQNLYTKPNVVSEQIAPAFSQSSAATISSHFAKQPIAHESLPPTTHESSFINFPLVTTKSERGSELHIEASKTHSKATKRNWLRFSLLGIMILSLIVMISVVVPDVYYRLLPESIADVTNNVSAPAGSVIQPVVAPTPAPTLSLPPVDTSLPTGDWLRIPTIGVNAGVLATDNPDEALEKGAWMVPDFGRPSDLSMPTIIASHRYGWLWWWQSDFGRKNSFYYLPDTKPGDIIEIITDQRRFEYVIYSMEEGQAITDYDADLILYTCKFLNSPERYFVYAKRIIDGQPTARETQSGESANFDKS